MSTLIPFIFSFIVFILAPLLTVTAAPVQTATGSGRHRLEIDCGANRIDLSDTLAAAYRALAQPDSTNYVIIFYSNVFIVCN